MEALYLGNKMRFKFGGKKKFGIKRQVAWNRSVSTASFRPRRLRSWPGRVVAKRFLNSFQNSIWGQYRKIIIVVACLAVISGAAALLFFSDFFHIQYIVIAREDLRIPVEELKQFVTDQVKDQNLLFFNKDQLYVNIRQKYPELERLEITRMLPRTLKIEAREYPIVALVKEQDKTETKVVNAQGVILPLLNETNQYPLIEIPSYEELRQQYSTILEMYINFQDYSHIMNATDLGKLLQTKQFLETKLEPITIIRYYPLEREMHFVFKSGYTIWLDLTKEINEQLTKLDKLYGQLNRLEYVDLRIKDKIIYCVKGDVCVRHNKT